MHLGASLYIDLTQTMKTLYNSDIPLGLDKYSTPFLVSFPMAFRELIPVLNPYNWLPGDFMFKRFSIL